jgi:hypothetical protein
VKGRRIVRRRSAFGVLVIPFALDAFAEVAYALWRKRDDEDDWWHAPAAQGARTETPLAAARRLAGVPRDAAYRALDSRAVVEIDDCPATCILPQYAYGVRVDPADLRAPAGHEQLWVSYKVAEGLLRSEAERNALWELRRRLGLPRVCR